MLTLYHTDMSLCAQKVRICLAEKGLAWEDKHLVLRAAEHQQPWYLKFNRRAVVPTLVHDGHVVPESNVILEYLEDVFPQLRLRPNDPYHRSKMRLWIKQLDEDVHDACAAILSFGIAFRLSSACCSSWTRWRRRSQSIAGWPVRNTAWRTLPLRRIWLGSST